MLQRKCSGQKSIVSMLSFSCIFKLIYRNVYPSKWGVNVFACFELYSITFEIEFAEFFLVYWTDYWVKRTIREEASVWSLFFKIYFFFFLTHSIWRFPGWGLKIYILMHMSSMLIAHFNRRQIYAVNGYIFNFCHPHASFFKVNIDF